MFSPFFPDCTCRLLSPFYIILLILYEIFLPQLRKLFIILWNEPRNGFPKWKEGTPDLYNVVKDEPKFDSLHSITKKRIKNGITCDFDLTTLFTVILDLNVFRLDKEVRNALWKSRKLRNNGSHRTSTYMSKKYFRKSINRICNAMQQLKMDTNDIQLMKTQTVQMELQ